MTYKYQALDDTPGAIRIFILQPAQQLDAPIVGDLQHVSHDSYRYTAISYVWGDPLHVHCIQISGHDFGVADNLFNVLRGLRRSAETISLWIDAICINQNDIPERNSQVQKMASIYRSAVEVVGSLGSTRPDFEMGLSLLRKLLVDDEQLYLEDSYAPAWEALIALLDKPYWTRVWILQETALNPNVVLKFGINSNKQINISDLSEFDNVRFEVVSKWRELHPDGDWEGSMMQKFDAISNDVYNMGYLPPLVPLTVNEFQPLLQSQICNGPLATNPLDYVYGVIGLFNTPILSVDYSYSPRQLYLKVIEVVQHRSGKLGFSVLGLGKLCARHIIVRQSARDTSLGYGLLIQNEICSPNPVSKLISTSTPYLGHILSCNWRHDSDGRLFSRTRDANFSRERYTTY